MLKNNKIIHKLNFLFFGLWIFLLLTVSFLNKMYLKVKENMNEEAENHLNRVGANFKN